MAKYKIYWEMLELYIDRKLIWIYRTSEIEKKYNVKLENKMIWFIRIH